MPPETGKRRAATPLPTSARIGGAAGFPGKRQKLFENYDFAAIDANVFRSSRACRLIDGTCSLLPESAGNVHIVA
jgi:hypothetical protein